MRRPLSHHTPTLQLGSQLELPKVQPIISFVLLLVTLACYATYLNISLLQVI